MYPMRGVFWIVYFLHTQADIYCFPTIPTRGHVVGECDNIVFDAFYDVCGESAFR